MSRVALGILTVLVIGLFPVSRGEAAMNCDPWIAEVVSAQGYIEAKRRTQTQWVQVELKDTYCAGDSIRTTEHSRAGLLLRNQTVLRLDQGTTLVLPEFKEEKSAWLELIEGAAHILSNIPYKLKVKTPFVNAAIEGTEFVMRVSERDTRTWVFEGRVVTENAHGRLSLESGDASVAEAGKAPVPLVVIKPRDAVQWALYYPPIIDYRPEVTPDPYLQQAIDFYRSGETGKAIAALNKAPKKLHDARYFTLRAGLLLSVGDVEPARNDISQAQTLDADDGTALALLSIIALTQNEGSKALALAQQAAKKDSQSPTPLIALSYAYQAGFDIEKARDSVKQALALSPDDPLAWARLSELELSLGSLDESLEAAEKAAALNPKLSRTQMVLGFAHLTQVDLDKAEAAFEKAIELDPASPLPRLGLGLAKIRQGDIEAGTKDIEVAAVLDPDNSLVRSYLGKAYYEEKREGVASREFAIAKALDPKDPTPWFYDAIYKQTVNRPVEALHDMQKAIELNDNRVVYRSGLLIDDDLAARSASLGRIYNDLGFQQRGLLEGWKSTNAAPNNFSAHRLLADNYAVLPRHEIARVSELLQAQLLQPINITPIQPNLAESNLLLLDGLGPSSNSFNEFNPLFNRNRFALQTSAIIGTNDTFGDEVVQSGVWDTVSYSLGQFHYETDGFRENNDLKQNIYNLFFQFTPSHKTSVQAEYRKTDLEHGDLEMRFNTNDFRTNFRQTIDTESIRLGFHHKLSSNSDIIGSGIYKQNKDIQRDEDPFIKRKTKFDEDGYFGELQYQYRWNWLTTIAGVGHLTSSGFEKQTIKSLIPDFPSPPFSSTPTDIQHTNVYLYSQIQLPLRIVTTLGISTDFFDASDSLKSQQINPKFGLIWNPFPATTLRLAGFRTLKKSLLSNQTIEPTQVAGFNQFFDDNNATDAWRYGIALDQQISTHFLTGVEVSRRKLKIPIFSKDKYKDFDIDEFLARTYLYWTPSHWLSASIEYQYERFKNNGEAIITAAGFKDIDTHKLPFRLNFNHQSGLKATIKATYVNQRGNFKFLNSPLNSIDGKSGDFWIVDTSVSFRLPNRLGIFEIGVRNIFDEKFRFQETDNAIQTIQPDRAVFGKLTLAF